MTTWKTKWAALAAAALGACTPSVTTDAGMLEPDGDAGATVDAGVAADAGHEHMGEVTRGRLMVADGDAGFVQFIDLDDGTSPGSFVLPAVATAYGQATDTAGMGYLMEPAVNQTQIVSSGVSYAEHDGHFHLTKVAPTLLSSVVNGSKMVHFVEHDGWVSIFNDGNGSLDYFQTAQVAIGMVVPRRWESGVSHHGVGLIFKEHVVATVPNPIVPDAGTHLPIGVSVHPAATPTTKLQEFTDCPNLHGEAASATRVAFGCLDGALILTWNGSAFDKTKLANPAGAAPNLRVSTIVGAEGLDSFVGNFGSSALSLIDPVAGTITAVALPAVSLGFKLFADEHLLVLTLDGKLHKLDPKTAVAQATPLEVLPAFESSPSKKPSLAVGADAVYVSDPRSGKVYEVEIEAWKLGRTFDVGGVPLSLQVLSASPDFHAHEH